VQGDVYAGGMGLVAACDMAVAVESAGFCLSEVRLGLIPATISTLYLKGGGEAGFHLYGLTMFICGILNTAMWAYASWKPGMMFESVGQRERWTKVAFSMALPILFLPVLALRSDQFGIVMLPIVVAVFIVRRVLAPRWLGKRV